MDKVVKVTHKKAYGREMWEPSNKTAELLCQLVGQDNLTIEQLKILSKLGYKIEQVTPKIAGL